VFSNDKTPRRSNPTIQERCVRTPVETLAELETFDDAEMRKRLRDINAIALAIKAAPFIKIGTLRSQLDQIAVLSRQPDAKPEQGDGR
jgi:hypothetical protein